MKKIIILVNILFIFSSLHAQQFPFGVKHFYPTEWGNLTIFENHYIHDDRTQLSNITFGKYYNLLNTEEKKYIVLYTELEKISFLTLIKHSSNSTGYFGNWEMYYSTETNPLISSAAMLQGFNVLSADSYIKETTNSGVEISYVPDKMFSTNANPWAVESESISKIIYLNSDKYRVSGFRYYPINYIVIVNGFICAGKEYLYEQNSRARNIRISYDNVSLEYELQDTANFQSIKLPKSIDPKAHTIIKIEILDRYLGTKYKDIVISGIYYMDAQME